MKQFLAIILLLFTLNGCKNDPDRGTALPPEECTEYACPVHKDKTSTTPGQCPQCERPLEKTGKKDTLKDSSKIPPPQ